jgi:para-nitrobenzyl esterase
LFLALGGPVAADRMAAALRVLGPAPDGEAAYRSAYPQAPLEQLFELVQSDWLFRMPSLHLARAQAEGGGRAYAYELTLPAPGMGGKLGACHGLDIPLTFGVYAGLGEMLTGPAPTPEIEATSSAIREAWTGFAATGDPGWPSYDPQRRLVRIFDESPSVAPYPEEASRRMWQDHAFPALPLLAG